MHACMGGNGSMVRALASVSNPLVANPHRQRLISTLVSAVAKMQPIPCTCWYNFVSIHVSMQVEDTHVLPIPKKKCNTCSKLWLYKHMGGFFLLPGVVTPIFVRVTGFFPQLNQIFEKPQLKIYRWPWPAATMHACIWFSVELKNYQIYIQVYTTLINKWSLHVLSLVVFPYTDGTSSIIRENVDITYISIFGSIYSQGRTSV
jgi:hypothetical protein